MVIIFREQWKKSILFYNIVSFTNSKLCSAEFPKKQYNSFPPTQIVKCAPLPNSWVGRLSSCKSTFVRFNLVSFRFQLLILMIQQYIYFGRWSSNLVTISKLLFRVYLMSFYSNFLPIIKFHSFLNLIFVFHWSFIHMAQ